MCRLKRQFSVTQSYPYIWQNEDSQPL